MAGAVSGGAVNRRLGPCILGSAGLFFFFFPLSSMVTLQHLRPTVGLPSHGCYQ